MTLTYDPVTQNQYPPLVNHNLLVKFESEWAKTAINMVPPLIIHNLHVTFESDWAKTVVAIVSTR